jgi:phage terminase large subunit-like protein
MNVCPPWDRPEYNEQHKSLTWKNGAQVFGYSAEKPERLRGPQFEAAWCDELAAWHRLRRQSTWDMLNFGLRLGNNPQCFVSTTPMPVDVIADLIKKSLAKHPGYVMTRGSTYANRGNLAASFLDSIVTRYEGTRLGRQELLGELLDDVPGALWTYDMIASGRVTKDVQALVPLMKRIIVSVDPSGAASANDENADEIGIVIAGQHQDDSYYVLADRSLRGSPQVWARTAVTAYHEFKADRIVAERNYGGEMVVHTLRGIDPNVPIEVVTASRGKAVRAEPVALLYEQGKVHHVGAHAKLEDQMIKMTAGGYVGDGSPDRLDALVWALSELSQGQTARYHGMF